MEITRTFDLLDHIRQSFPKDDMLAGKENGKWVKYSNTDYHDIATSFSLGLMAMGIKKGDMVALISNNRPEWNFVDMGLSQAGIVHIPIYPTISLEEYTYILNHAEPKIVIVSDQQLYDKLRPIVEQNNNIFDIYTINEVKGAKNWKEIVESGKEKGKEFEPQLQKIKKEITPDEMVTLIYTSGTTGNPKGVMLSHENIVSNVKACSAIIDMDETKKVLSFLPLCHAYERTATYLFQWKGMSIYYAENMGTIVDDLKVVKPYVFNSVPRLLERVYDKIISKGKELTGVKRKIFFWANSLGLRYETNRQNGWWYHTQLKIADKLVFSKWREALGGNTKFIISGGAALQPRLGRIFTAADINILEGYGLTETSPIIAVNNYNRSEIRFGTVGPVLDNIEVKIADDGEILCKGPSVMLGYFKEPEMTKEVLDDDGWFHTGDIGILEDNKYLKITDRKKSIFKLSSGKYVAPQVIENKLKESIFIEQAMVVGENEKFASALISPNFLYLHNWCSEEGVDFHANEDLIENQKVLELFQKEVNETNKKLGQVDQIKRFRIVKDEWSPNTGELSPTLKLKRVLLHKRYSDIIAKIYGVQKKEELSEV